MPEAWLRGPVDGVPERLMPVAHSLIDALEEIETAVADLDTTELWSRPAGAASVGFHLRHIPGALDRLLTYARGESLDAVQLDRLRNEAEPGDPPATAAALVQALRDSVDQSLAQLKATPEATLPEPRSVGRQRLPSTVQGLLFHAAEHTRRHAGQVLVTARVVRAGWVEEKPLTLETLAAAVSAWEDAGVRGLCNEGRLELLADFLRSRGHPVPGRP
jgi:uncharacterized damage-inducible protein DinB